MPFGYMLAPAEKESKTADKNFKLCIQMFVNGVAKKKLLIEFYSSIGLMQFSKWRKNVMYSIFLIINASLLLETIFTKTNFCNDNKVRRRRQRQSNFKVFYLAGCFTD